MSGFVSSARVAVPGDLAAPALQSSQAGHHSLTSAPRPRPIRVAVLDDWPLVTAGLAALLEPFAHRISVSPCEGDLPARGTTDVVLFDTFGRPDAINLIGDLRRSTGSRVLIYTWAVDPGQLSRFVRCGAAGFASKANPADALVRAVELVHSGRTVDLAAPERSQPVPAWPGQESGLTEREAEVVALVAVGMTNHQIAELCYLSINTIKTYIRSAYRKMGVTTRSAAVIWGREHGLHSGTGLHDACGRAGAD